MGEFAAQLLLGHVDAGELILTVGPEYQRMQQTAAEAGIQVRRASQVWDNMQSLKAGVAVSGKSLALTASASEVEGILDRSAFGPHITEMAYDVDRVVYFGSGGAVVVHPVSPGTCLEVRGGVLRVRQHLDSVGPGEAVIGVTLGQFE